MNRQSLLSIAIASLLLAACGGGATNDSSSGAALDASSTTEADVNLSADASLEADLALPAEDLGLDEDGLEQDLDSSLESGSGMEEFEPTPPEQELEQNESAEDDPKATNNANENTASDSNELYTTYSQYAVQDGITVADIAITSAVNSGDAKIANIIEVEFDALSVNKKVLFDDTATFQEIESYRITTKQLVKFAVEEDTLNITNWVPRDLHEVAVIATVGNKELLMLNLDKVPGLHQFKIALPWALGATSFTTLEGDIVDLEAIDTSAVTFKLLPRDEVQNEIARINLDWKIAFPDRVMNGRSQVCRDGNVVWRPTRPQDGRYLLTFMIHAAQTVSQPTFYDFWMKTPFRDFEGGISEAYRLTQEELNTYSAKEKALYDHDALAAGGYYNKAHRQMVFNRYYEKKFNLGMTGGGGLGGGSTVGVNHNKINELAWSYAETAAAAYAANDWFLPEGDKSYNATAWNIFGHETGHALGFGHKQTYNVRSMYSHITIGTIVYSGLVKQGKTIVTADTMTNRDLEWERPYKKKAPAASRSRPRCGEAFEWGGAYERHDYQMPQKGTPEWDLYIEAHLEGRGLEYLKELNISPATYYSWWTPAN